MEDQMIILGVGRDERQKQAVPTAGRQWKAGDSIALGKCGRLKPFEMGHSGFV